MLKFWSIVGSREIKLMAKNTVVQIDSKKCMCFYLFIIILRFLKLLASFINFDDFF